MRQLMQTDSRQATPSSSRQRWFLAALLLLFIGQSIQYSFKISGESLRSHPTTGETDQPHRGAITRWRESLQHLFDDNIYDRFNYPNPPIMALLLTPIATLPPLAGALCWFYLKVGMTLLALWWIFRMIQTSEKPFPPWAQALTILLSLRPIMGDLSHGNVNLFILFLVIAGLYAFHRARDVLAGLTLALAMACKVTPALFIPYLLWKRAWKSLAGCAVGLVLFLVVVPGGFLGGSHNWESLHSWVEHMVSPYVVEGTVTTDHLNQSLPGLVHRLATDSPSHVDDHGTPLKYDNLAHLDPRLAGWLIKSCMALFALVVVWVCRTPTTDRRSWRLAAEFSLVLLGMLLFSERTWKHHCVTLVLPFAVLCYYLATCRPGPWLRGYLIGSLTVVVLLMTATGSTGFWPALDEFTRTAQVYGVYVWAYLVLVAALAVLLRRPDNVPHGENGPCVEISWTSRRNAVTIESAAIR
jgi:hypothetical protein